MPFCWFCHEAAHLSLFHRCELVIIPSFRTHRSEEQSDQGLHCLFTFLGVDYS